VMGFSRLRDRFAVGDGRRLMLGLQGGGAHGAFSWGVLDGLLEEPGLTITGCSGTSAGALNAAVFASGWMHGGRQGARDALADFWKAISDAGSGGWTGAMLGMLSGVWQSEGDLAARMLQAVPRMGSPYQLYPQSENPLRELLDQRVDLEALAAPQAPRLVIAATNVHTGRARLFTNRELSIDVLLASACLPAFFQAIELDGEYYWDGGYSLNPPILPLLRQRLAPELLVVQLNARWRDAVPTDADGIAERARELAFNAGQLRERVAAWLADGRG